MNEQRRDILGMLAEGKLTAGEAERLIDAVERDQLPATASPSARPKYLRLVIETIDRGEPGRINARIPLQLLRAGVQLAALVPPHALARANDELSRSGVPIDLTQLKPAQLEALVDHLDEVTFEIDQPDAKINIFCE